MIDTDVLVVGAGPTGLTLAASLLRRDADVIVVDRLVAGANTSRAAAVNARTLEVLRLDGDSWRLVATHSGDVRVRAEPFDAVELDLTRRMERALRRSGMAIWRMSQDDYLAWLQLAQQTAWVQYATINPRAKELLLATVRTVLVGRSDKDTLIDSIFGEDKKD